jgi:exportin-2 (importin alpha re-exporter)
MGDEASQLAQLAQCLSASLSPDAATRQNAEQFLASGAQQAGFSILLLKLVSSDGADAPARVAGAVAFKNLVKKHWTQVEPDVVGAPAPYCVGDAEKDQVRNLLVGLMLDAPKLAKAQLSEALSIVSAADFPEKWPGLLPELNTRLGVPGSTRDWSTVAGVLTTANTIFKKYRQAYKSEALYKELKYALDGFAKPVLFLTLEAVDALTVATSHNDTPACVSLLKCVRLVCRIFFSLNSQELPEVFEDDMDKWMGAFHGLLAYENVALDGLNEKSPSDAVKAAICDNVNLYIEKNEEEFARFLNTFVQDVWVLLTKTGLESTKDHLVTSGIKFLTAVANSVHHSLFAGGDTLRQVCESIVIPNLTFTADDEELFETNHVEYVRRDIEGSDSDTRRRGACELVRALTAKFPDVMAQSVSGYVGALLQQHATDPGSNWKAKDAAVTLVVALLVKSKTASKGATELNELGLSVVDFFNTQIAPELASAARDGGAGALSRDVGVAVLRADSLKFVTVFRGFLPKQVIAPHLPAIVACLRARENVTHTYAANCLDKLLATRETSAVGAPSKPRFDASDLVSPTRDALFRDLFGVFDMPDSRENEYAMRAFCRVVTVLGDEIKPLATACVAKLASFLAETCANPKNPTFSHFLFEGVAGLTKAAATDAATMAAFETALFPPFQFVLQQDVVEFAPYVFQLLAQMIETRTKSVGLRNDPLPAAYLAIFPALLAPALWDRQANVVALVRLLEAYLRKAPAEIASGASSRLTGVLGVFQKLVASRAQDHQGFFILNAFAECLPLAGWKTHLPAVWGVLFSRLQTSKTPKFTKCLVVFTCLLAAKHGPACVEETMAAVQPGIFEMIVKSVLTEAAPAVAGAVETKIVAVAGANVLSESAGIKADVASWCKFLSAVVATLEKPQEVKDAEAAARGEGGDANAEAEAAENEAGYAAAYNALRNAARVDVDPCADVADPKTNLAQKLALVSAQAPGVFSAAIATNCPPEVQQALAAYCAAAQVAIQ